MAQGRGGGAGVVGGGFGAVRTDDRRRPAARGFGHRTAPPAARRGVGPAPPPAFFPSRVGWELEMAGEVERTDAGGRL